MRIVQTFTLVILVVAMTGCSLFGSSPVQRGEPTVEAVAVSEAMTPTATVQVAETAVPVAPAANPAPPVALQPQAAPQEVVQPVAVATPIPLPTCGLPPSVTPGPDGVHYYNMNVTPIVATKKGDPPTCV